MTFATFPVCFRSVRDYLNQINQRNQRTADGLQIRVHQFESDTCLQYSALTAADVTAIKARIVAGEPNTHIARDYPITHSMVSRIKRGKAWASGQRRIGGME